VGVIEVSYNLHASPLLPSTFVFCGAIQFRVQLVIRVFLEKIWLKCTCKEDG